jgi:uncharacterized integral membrane protein
MLRKIVNALVILPLAILFVVFAVANRQLVTLSFDPFDSSDPALGVTLPLFIVIIAAAIFGVMAGSIATWFGQHRWRKAAKLHEAEARHARTQLADLRERMQVQSSPDRQVPAVGYMSQYGSVGRDKPGATL